jgi:uncharacterized protein DUF4136
MFARMLSLGVMTLLIAACSDTTLPPAGELDVVLALRDDTVNFQAIERFAMPDTVLHLDEIINVGGAPVTRQFDAEILDQVAKNFEARGYVRELSPQTSRPDVVVLVAVTASTQVTAWVSYPWFSTWGFYPGWGFYSGFSSVWGVTYPWAPVASAFVWRSGTLLVDAIDARNIDVEAKQIHSVWGAALNGVLNGESPEARLVTGIDKMFVLSPYLHR